MISNKCVNPETKRPYPVSIIEKAMKECHIAVKPNKSSKQQALDTIGKLKTNLSIERAMMRMKLVVPIRTVNKIRKYLTKQDQNVKIESEEKVAEEMIITLLASPGLYRDIESTVRDETQVQSYIAILSNYINQLIIKGAGSLELLNLIEVRDEEEKL